MLTLDASIMSEHSSTKTPPTPTDVSPGNQPAQESLDLATEYLAGWQRAKADYANLKREIESKQLELIRYANEDLLKELLPLVDYFKQALRAVPPEQRGQSWVQGIQHIQSKLEQVLAYYGVKELNVVGEKFDPALHEAVGESDGAPPGTITEEVRTGFILHDKLLQAARVKVAR